MIIKYFAWLKNITNTEEEEVSNKNIIDIKTLKKFLLKKYPKFNKYMKVIAINERMELEQDYFLHKGKTYQLIPGIQVTCGILTGKRRVFEYLLDPFLSSMDYAFHER